MASPLLKQLPHSHSDVGAMKISRSNPEFHHSHSANSAHANLLIQEKMKSKPKPGGPDAFYSSTSSLAWAGGLVATGSRATGIDRAGKEDEDGGGDDETLSLEGKVTWPLVITAAVTAFGSSFPHGWNTGVLNAPSTIIKGFLNESFVAHFGTEPNLSFLWSLSVSIYLVGGCAGAFSAGVFADKCGRKRSLLILHVFGLVSAVLFGLCDFANSFEMFVLARLIVGYGCGAGSGLVPMYLVEIAPVNVRGGMGVVHQFALTCGILFSQLIGLRQVLGNEDMWPYLLALTGLPCIVSLLVLPWFPESPRYLFVNKADRDGAEKALQRFRGREDVKMDMLEMELERKQVAEEEEAWSFKQLLSAKNLRMPLIIVCSLACCQQLSGINVVFYYSSSVFETSGIPMDYIQWAVLGTGIINVIMTGISVPLMEKSGRRMLLLVGMLLMAIAAILITIALNVVHLVSWFSYISVICTFLFIIGFAIGLGSIPQFIPAELFKQGPRPPAMSIAGFLNWLCNFLIGIIFPFMDQWMAGYSFIPFIAGLTAFGTFFYFKLPETKGKTYEEIQDHFDKRPADPSPEAPEREGLMDSTNGHVGTGTNGTNGETSFIDKETKTIA